MGECGEETTGMKERKWPGNLSVLGVGGGGKTTGGGGGGGQE